MPELSLHDIDRISNDIRKQEITVSHLLDELIDHVCCDVENEMQYGLNFHEAYLLVKERMGNRRLKEIQEETLYAVDTKYRQMKKTMKFSGIAGTVLLAFAAMFKIMHLAGAGLLLSLGGITLAFVFVPSALVILWKETHSGKRLFLFISAFFAGMFFIMGAMFKIQHWEGAAIVLILAAICGSLLFIPALLASKLREQDNTSKRLVYFIGAAGLLCYITGMLFRIQHWPWSNLLLMGGIIVIFFVVFPWYTWLTWKNDKNVSARFIFMVIGSLTVMIPSALINMNLRRDYDRGFFEHQQEQHAMYKYLLNNNRSFMSNCSDSAVSPVLLQISMKTNELLDVINGIEAGMIAESEGGSPAAVSQQIVQTADGPEIQFGLLKSPFDPGPVRSFLIPGCDARTVLDDALKGYTDFMVGLTPGGDLRRNNELPDPSLILQNYVTEGRMTSLMSGLHSLELLKNCILTVESKAFSAVAVHQ